MTLPIDWLFTPSHQGLDESGRVGTGQQTLGDFACTVALTEPGGLPEDPSFGTGLFGQLQNGTTTAESFSAQIRGHLLQDDRVEEVSVKGETRVGTLTLPITIVPSDGPYSLSGPLTPELIEEIIADMGLEDGEEAS